MKTLYCLSAVWSLFDLSISRSASVSVWPLIYYLISITIWISNQVNYAIPTKQFPHKLGCFKILFFTIDNIESRTLATFHVIILHLYLLYLYIVFTHCNTTLCLVLWNHWLLCCLHAKRNPLMRFGASVVWRLSLPLMNSFNKTEAAIFPMQSLLP